MPDQERLARRALACVIEAGDLRAVDAIRRAGPEETWAQIQRSARQVVAGGEGATPWARRAATLDPESVTAAEAQLGLRFVIPGDEEWPAGLDDLERCAVVQGVTGSPFGVWVRGAGQLAADAARSVAVVGSRACTAYGARVATELGAQLVSAGVCVVSGGAYGVDAAAHRGALADGGPTIAFLAGGLHELYPRENAGLLEQVARVGVLVSEYPPGFTPTRPRFLARNRLIAAVSQGTVVVEGAARSGAHNTATWAVECGRHLMAVPGPIGNSTSATPHRLIREGKAVLVTGIDDVRQLLEPLGTVEDARPAMARLLDQLSDRERSAYEALPSRGGRDADEIARRSGLRTPDCLAALGSLSLSGLATRRADGRWGLGKVGDRPMLPHETQERMGATMSG